MRSSLRKVVLLGLRGEAAGEELPEHSGRKQAGIPEADSLSLDATLARGTSSDSELEVKSEPLWKSAPGGTAQRSEGRGLGAWQPRAERSRRAGERVAMQTECLSSLGDKEVPSFDNSCQRHTHHTAGREGAGGGGEPEESVWAGAGPDFQ